MKSSLRSDEIFSLRLQMKLNPPPSPAARQISSRSDFIQRSWIYSVRKDGFNWKKPFAFANGFFLGRGGRTRSRRYDAKPNFWLRLCYATSVFRGSDSPPDCHSLPLPFESSSNYIPAKRKSPRKTWTLSFWQGREDSNPRPTVLEWLRSIAKPWNCSLFRTFQCTFQAKPRVVIVSENFWCFIDAIRFSALHIRQ